MEQDTDASVSITPVTGSDKQNNGNGLKIVTVIVCIVAVCGIGFGVYGIIQSLQKDSQIVSLKTQLEKYENTDKDKPLQTIPDGYIAVFHGGTGEMTHETYIYKDDNGHDNYGFTYINTTSTTRSWGSPEWETEITKRGSFEWTDGAFIVAQENGAYSYVTVPDSDKTYSIEEFEKMFLRN